jgi:hypothetical protein
MEKRLLFLLHLLLGFLIRQEYNQAGCTEEGNIAQKGQDGIAS